jgi:hypothetical protein
MEDLGGFLYEVDTISDKCTVVQHDSFPSYEGGRSHCVLNVWSCTKYAGCDSLTNLQSIPRLHL